MYDTFVRRNCLTSRKTINILIGVTAMFVYCGGGQGGYMLYVVVILDIISYPEKKKFRQKSILLYSTFNKFFFI